MSKLLIRLLLGLLFAFFGFSNYFGNVSQNPVTGERQHIALSPQQEVVLGRQGYQEVLPQTGGLYPSQSLQDYIDRIGVRVVEQSAAAQSPYPFEFHLLDAPGTINAFALPGGQIFVTTGLLGALNSEAQLAGVLGHEVGHVVARHGAEHLAKQQLGAILINAVGIAASDDLQSGRQAAAIAQAVSQLVDLRYGRADELESDRLGLEFMTAANYDPRGIVELMEIFESAQSRGRPPEFLSSHPSPENRIVRLEEMIRATYPDGIPERLMSGEGRFSQIVAAEL